jgi:hypothetical protein
MWIIAAAEQHAVELGEDLRRGSGIAWIEQHGLCTETEQRVDVAG